MLARRHLLGLFRLLVVIAALFSAQPSVAAQPRVDPVVLVAGTTIAAPADQTEDDARTPLAPAPLATALAATPVAGLAPLQSTRALRERAYLLHCALLR